MTSDEDNVSERVKPEHQLRFRTSDREWKQSHSDYGYLEQLSDDELEDRSKQDHRALFLLGWRAAWNGERNTALQILDKVEDVTYSEDHDILAITKKFWTAIAQRDASNVWRHMSTLEAATNRRMLRHRLALVYNIYRARSSYLTYLLYGLFAALTATALLVGNWAVSAVLVVLLAGYLVFTLLAFKSTDKWPTGAP